MNCGAVKHETRYFLDGSDRYFSLEGVTFAKAVELLSLFKAGSVTGLPEWETQDPDWKTADIAKISLIKQMPDGLYLLIFGDYVCAGCASRITVRLESEGEKHLVVVGQPDRNCY